MDSLSYTKRYTTPFLNMKRITHVMMMMMMTMTMITNVMMMMMTSQFQLNMMEGLKKQEVDHIHHLTFASQKDKMVKTTESYYADDITFFQKTESQGKSKANANKMKTSRSIVIIPDEFYSI